MRFLLVDKIIDLIPGKKISGLKHISEDEYYLYKQGDQSYFPPSLIGEALGQLAAWNVMLVGDFKFRPVAGLVSKACLHRKVRVGETLILESFIENLDESSVLYNSVASIGKERVFTVEGALGPLLPMDQFISEDVVRAQFEQVCKHSDSEHFYGLPALPLNSLSFENTLSFDKIIHVEPGKALIAEKSISANSAFFPDHFPRRPVLPMTVLLEAKLNLAQEFIRLANFKREYQIKNLCKIKMNEFVNPGDTLICYLQVQKQDNEALILRYRSEVQGKRVCVLDVHMEAKG